MQEPSTGQGGESQAGSGAVTAAKGDCIFSIADEHGFFWETVWKHPENKELADARGSPHVLRPGDRVFVPDLTRGEETGATEARHRFRKKGVPIEFAIEVLEDDEPRAGVPYTLTIEGRETSGDIPDDGIVRAAIYPGDRSGELRVGPPEDERIYPIRLGHLGPSHTRAGAAARLQNMGLLSTANPSDEAFATALERFQKRQGLEMTGTLDDATATKLAEVHGS